MEITARLGLEKPAGNENVSRQQLNNNFQKVDDLVALDGDLVAHRDATWPHPNQQLLYLTDPVTGKKYRFGIDGNLGRMYYEEVV